MKGDTCVLLGVKGLINVEQMFERLSLFFDLINPFVPSVPNIYSTFDQIFNFNLRSVPQKCFYERRAYESVDEMSLS